MKKSKLIFMCFLLVTFFVNAQNESSEINSPYNDAGPNQGSEIYSPEIEAMWDVLLQFDVAALNGQTGNAGAEWNGTYFYSTRWQSNLIHEYDAAGATLLREFSIPGVNGLRDLAFDGTHFYGGAAGNLIYEMDFASETLISTINTTEAVRHIAYDSDQDAFWVGNWDSDIVAFDRSGTELARITATTHGVTNMYGSCYDNNSAGGPFLWVFSQGAGAGNPQNIIQLQLPGGTPTGVAHNVITDVGAGNPNAIAGGLFSMTDFNSGLFTIGGLLQGSPTDDILFVYEIGPLSSVQNEGGLPNDFNLEQNYPNPFNPNTTINYSIPENSFVNLVVYNMLGEKIVSLVNEVQNAGIYTVNFDAKNLTSGTYIYQLKSSSSVLTRKMVLLK